MPLNYYAQRGKSTRPGAHIQKVAAPGLSHLPWCRGRVKKNGKTQKTLACLTSGQSGKAAWRLAERVYKRPVGSPALQQISFILESPWDSFSTLCFTACWELQGIRACPINVLLHPELALLLGKISSFLQVEMKGQAFLGQLHREWSHYFTQNNQLREVKQLAQAHTADQPPRSKPRVPGFWPRTQHILYSTPELSESWGCLRLSLRVSLLCSSNGGTLSSLWPPNRQVIKNL